MNRRNFLKQSSAASVAFSALPLLPALRRTAPYRLALIGCGWWGMNILREAIAAKNCKVVALCDVDTRHLDQVEQEVKTLNGDRPKRYKDYRELITQEKPEIVIIGTPDHWHALPMIMAVQNGAHVYVEKPIGHTVNEGKAMLKAARDHHRVVQVGTHRRVSPHNLEAMEFLRSGKVGTINKVHCFVNYAGNAGTKRPDEAPPKELDWEMWCGPAPMRPFNPSIHPKGFRHYLDYANGTIADWGIHWFDQVLWWSEEKVPKHIYSVGDIFIRNDGSDAPDTQTATFTFDPFILTWEHKRGAKNFNEDHNIGCYFYGTEGTLHLGWRDGWTFYPKSKNASVLHSDPQLNDPDHQNIKELWADFIQAIETGKKPACDIEYGYQATNLSLLAMASMKLGRSIAWDGNTIPGDEAAQKLLSREYRGEWEYPM